MAVGGDDVLRQAPLVWRSTLRGVLVLDGGLRRLEGLGAAIWLALDEGPLDRDELVERLGEWSVDVAPEDLDEALDGLRAGGLLVR